MNKEINKIYKETLKILDTNKFIYINEIKKHLKSYPILIEKLFSKYPFITELPRGISFKVNNTLFCIFFNGFECFKLKISSKYNEINIYFNPKSDKIEVITSIPFDDDNDKIHQYLDGLFLETYPIITEDLNILKNFLENIINNEKLEESSIKVLHHTNWYKKTRFFRINKKRICYK